MYESLTHRKSIELQGSRILRFAVNHFQDAYPLSNSFSSATVDVDVDVSRRDGRKGKNFTVSYLVDSLGLTSKLAESISRKVSFEDKGNPEAALNLLRTHGFTDSQISSIVETHPRLLIEDADKSLAPKLQFLQSRGASTSQLTEIVSKVPKILAIKDDKTIWVYYDFIKEIIEADKSSKFDNLCHCLPEGSRQENKIRNVLVLRELGVPQPLLFSLLITAPFLCGKGKFKESLKKLIDMGFDPTTTKFVKALRIIQRLSDKAIEEKVKVYSSLGLSVDDLWEMFKKHPPSLTNSDKKLSQIFRTLKGCGLHKDEILSVLKKFPQWIGISEQKIENSINTFIGLGFTRDEYVMMVKRMPQCIGYSAESVKKKTEFVVKKMNWPLKAVTVFPQVFGLSMEKRIVPRSNIIKTLMSKGFLGSELPSMAHVLAITDQTFLNKYVRKHEDKVLVAELMAIFNEGTHPS